MNKKYLTMFGLALAAMLAIGAGSMVMPTVFAYDENGIKQKIEQKNDCKNDESVCDNNAQQIVQINPPP